MLLIFGLVSQGIAMAGNCQNVIQGHINYLQSPLLSDEISRNLTLDVVSTNASFALGNNNTTRVSSSILKATPMAVSNYFGYNYLQGSGDAYQYPNSNFTLNKIGHWSVTINANNSSMTLKDHYNKTQSFSLECKRGTVNNEVMVGVSTRYIYKSAGSLMYKYAIADTMFLVSIGRSTNYRP